MADVTESHAGASEPPRNAPDFIRRATRADALFIGVIAIVGLLVVALFWAFSAYSQLRAQTIDTISIGRGVRYESVFISQGMADVQAARRAELSNRSATAARIEAEENVRRHVAALHTFCDDVPQLAAISTRISELIEQEFALAGQRLSERQHLARSAELRAEIWEAIDDLRVAANRLNDTARGIEGRTRQQLDIIAIVLGLLSLLAAGFAGASLKRERESWRMAHAAAEEARAKAAASDLAKTRFLAVASHDMRQPLHALTLYLTALERRVEGAEVREIVLKMDRAVNSMVGMFSSLLEVAKLQAAVVTPEISVTPVQHVLDLAAAAHVEGTVWVEPTSLAVRTDPRMLERIVANLVTNGVRHGGGKVWLSAAQHGATVKIRVCDEGPGIAAEDQERMFTEFERLGARNDGLGLGLPIVKRLVAMLDIDLRVRSSPGEGAEFIITVPAAEAPAAGDERCTTQSIIGTPVLVMDDDQLAREAICGFLQDIGADVRSCADGEEAQAIVANGFAPKLLVLDLRIKGRLDGLSIGERLRELIAPPPRIIMVTGDTEQQTLEALRASGYDWLIKPVSAQDLNAAAVAQLRAA